MAKDKNYHEERPWGNFEILYEEHQLKIKRIVVKPGKRLSLQSHKYRCENWIIIAGTAVVSLNGKSIHLTKNQSVFIPHSARHRIGNQGSEEVVFIEVQTGSYLGEDDIERFEDDFNRV